MDRALRRLMRHVQDLEYVLGEIRLFEAGGEVFRDQRRLAGVLHHHRVAGEDRRQNGVQRGHVGEVPGRQIEHNAQRLAADEALEAFLRSDVDIGQHPRRDIDHVAGALLEAAHLARPVADRPSHLPGEQFRHARRVGHHRIGEGGHRCGSARRPARPPVALRGAGALQRGEHGLVIGERTLGIDRAVDRRDDAQSCVHGGAQ